MGRKENIIPKKRERCSTKVKKWNTTKEIPIK